MPPTSRATTANAASNSIASAYTLALLSEYTHTLDSLPIDLSRNFADLRELDAVLSTAMTSITTKIQKLTKMIEDGQGHKGERLWLLTEIAEEAKNLKPGGEDKIRVACLAADNLRSHINHLRTLLEHVPGFDTSALDRQTTYPHVASKTYLPVATLEGGRRRRGAQGSLLTTSAVDPSPVKRKRVNKDDDGGSPRKERVVDGPNAKPRNAGARARRIDRAGSPTESVVSVTSHQQGPAASSRAAASTSRANGTANVQGGARRARATNNNSGRGASPSAQDAFGTDGYDTTQRRDIFNVPPSSSHPSLPLPFHGANGHVFDPHISPSSLPLSGPGTGGDWPPRQLEGPGMPVSRSFADPVVPATTSNAAPRANGANTNTNISANSASSNTGNANAAAADADDPGEDDKAYCFCAGSGYGEMIGCDDNGCPREWFHLTCLQIAAAPAGKWYCDECTVKRNKSRAARGGRRRVAGGRNGAR